MCAKKTGHDPPFGVFLHEPRLHIEDRMKGADHLEEGMLHLGVTFPQGDLDRQAIPTLLQNHILGLTQLLHIIVVGELKGIPSSFTSFCSK